jgi:glycosyltransferase involved in cell wall biosynthesis
MAAADLFVFPSLYEGLGGALIEAMALGLPVVASDLPALREVVRAGENADLVAPGDAHGLAQAILGLLHDTERRLMYAERSRSIFSSEFQADIATERTLDLLARAARAPHTA